MITPSRPSDRSPVQCPQPLESRTASSEIKPTRREYSSKALPKSRICIEARSEHYVWLTASATR